MEVEFINNLLNEKKALASKLKLIDALIEEYSIGGKPVASIISNDTTKILAKTSIANDEIQKGPRDSIMQAIDYYGRFVSKKEIIDYLESVGYTGPKNFFLNMVNYLRTLKDAKTIAYVKHDNNNLYTFWGRIEWFNSDGSPKTERLYVL